MKNPYLLVCLLMLSSCCLCSCLRDSSTISLTLDQAIHNSYLSAQTDNNSLGLADFETVIYDQNHRKVSTRSTDVKLEGVAFRLSLIDYNMDGRFDVPGIDLVVVSIYGEDTVALNIQEAYVGFLRKQTFIQINRQCFLLSDIVANGDKATLVPWDRCPPDIIAARMKTTLGKVSVRDLVGQDTFLSFPKVDNRPRVLVVWGYDDASQELIRALQNQHAAWDSRYQLMSLNMSDELDKIQGFLKQNPLNFPVYLVTRKTCETINCHALMPYAIILNPKGEIINTNLKKEALLELMITPQEL